MTALLSAFVGCVLQGVVESKNNCPLYNPDSVSFMKLTHKNISENVKVNFQMDIILLTSRTFEV